MSLPDAVGPAGLGFTALGMAIAGSANLYLGLVVTACGLLLLYLSR